MGSELLERFDSRETDEIEDYVSALWSRMRIGGTGHDTRARITRRVLTAQVEFDDAAYGFDIGYDAQPPERIIIADVASGTIRRGDDGDAPEDRFGPGDQFLISRPGLPYRGVAYAARLRFTQLDPAVLAQVAGNAVDQPAPLLGHRPVSRAAQLRLQRAITHVRQTVLSGDGSPSRLLAASAVHYLGATLLHTYPNGLVTAPGGADERDASSSTLARAKAYIEMNPDLPINLGDIAAAAYVTPRAVQLAFRRRLGTTPLAYLRQVRLHHAHADLQRGTPADTTVSAVAARWGFSSSNLAREHRATFGVLPRETLEAT